MSPLLGPDDPKKKKKPPAPVVAEEPFDVDAFEAEVGVQDEEPFDVDAFEAEGNVAQAMFEVPETRPARVQGLNLAPPAAPDDRTIGQVTRSLQGKPRWSERGIGTEPGFMDTLAETNQQASNFLRGVGATVQRRLSPEAPELTQEDREDFGIEEERRRPTELPEALGRPKLPDLDPEGFSGTLGQTGAELGLGVAAYMGGGGAFGQLAKGTRVGTFLENLAAKGVLGRAAANTIPVAPIDALYGINEPFPKLEEEYGKAGGRALSVAANVATNFGAEALVHGLGGVYHEWKMRQGGPANARLVGDTRRVAESLEDLNRVEASRMAQEAAATQGRSDLVAALEKILAEKRVAAAGEVATREAEITARRTAEFEARQAAEQGRNAEFQARRDAAAAVQAEPPSPMGALLRGADEQLLEGQRAAGARRQNAAEEAAKAAEAQQAREELANAIRGFHEAGGPAQVEGQAPTIFQRNYESIFPERTPEETAALDAELTKPDERLEPTMKPPAEPPGEPPAGAGGAPEAPAAAAEEEPAWDADYTPQQREELRQRVQSEPRLTEFDDDDILDARMRQKTVQPVDYSRTPEGLQQREANVQTLLDNRGESRVGEELGDIPGRMEAPLRRGEAPEVHLVTGLPGAGKNTSVVRDLIENEGLLGATLIDTDEGKKLIEGFDQGRGANAVHAESQAHIRGLFKQAVAEKRDLIFPTVGRNEAFLRETIERLKAQGYEVFLHHLDIPKEEAGKRAVSRFRDRTGKLARFVDPHYVVNEVGDLPREAHQAVRFMPELSGTRHLDNMVPKGAKPNVIEATGRYAATGDEAARARAGGGAVDAGHGGGVTGGAPGDAGAAAAPAAGPAEPQPIAPRPRVQGVEGKESRVTLPSGDKYPVKFRLVEAADIQASHDPQAFTVNPEYPAGVQGRRYHADRAAQENVVEATTKLDPDLLLHDTGTAEGTPIITEGGIVLSGNQRAMMVKRAAGQAGFEGGELSRYERYVAALSHQLEALGLPESALDNFENPVLVREVSAEHVDPTNPEAMQAFNASSDVATGKAKSAIDEGMTRATKLMRAEDAISFFSETMGDETLRAYLDGPRGKQFLDALVRDGVISRAELGRLVQDGKLTVEAKQLLERTMYAAAVGDPDVLERIPGKIKQKLDTAIPAIVRANAIPGYSLQEPLQAALRELANVAEAGAGISSLADLRAQASMFGDDPLVLAGRGLSDYLELNPKAKVTEAFQRYANGAKEATAHGGADDIFGVPPETPEQLVARAFGRPPQAGEGLGRAGYIGMRAKSLEHRTWKDEVRALRFDGDDDTADALAAFMQGAEVKTPVFHGAVTDFDQFMFTQDFGFHTGTPDQATDRALHKAGYQPDPQANLMPLWVRGKFAEMKDLGDWGPREILREVMDRDYLTAAELERLREPYLRFNRGPDAAQVVQARKDFMAEFRTVMREAGYSGIKYRNVGEGGRASARRRGEPASNLVQYKGDKKYAYAVFDPSDYKSATGNTGQFDPNNPDIRGHTGLNLMAGIALGGGGGFGVGSQQGETPEERLRNGVLLGLAGLAVGAGGGAAASGLPGRTWKQHVGALEHAGEAKAAKNLTRFMRNSKVPSVVFHGTTGDFTAFNPKQANIESDWGAGFYFTDSPADVSANYAGFGPDLSARIERRSEARIYDEGMTPEQAREEAKRELGVGANQGAAMPVYLNLENPAIVGGKGETRLTLDYPQDEAGDFIGEPTGTLMDFTEGLRQAARRYDDANVEGAIDELLTAGLEGDLSVAEAQRIVKNHEGAMYAADENGDLASSELVRAALEHAGFDGVIDRSANVKFGSERTLGRPMEGMEPGTTHYIAFKPEQIKSATGNRGTFGPDVTDVTGAIGDQPPKQRSFLGLDEFAEEPAPRELEEGGEAGDDLFDMDEYEKRTGVPPHGTPEREGWYIGNNLNSLERSLEQLDELDRTGRVTYPAHDHPKWGFPAGEMSEADVAHLKLTAPARLGSTRHHIKQLVKEFREKFPQEPVPHADRLRAQGFEVPEPGALSLFDEPEQPRSRYEVDEEATGYDPVNEPEGEESRSADERIRALERGEDAVAHVQGLREEGWTDNEIARGVGESIWGKGNKNLRTPDDYLPYLRGSLERAEAERAAFEANPPESDRAYWDEDTRRAVEAAKRRLSGWEDAFKEDADLFDVEAPSERAAAEAHYQDVAERYNEATDQYHAREIGDDEFLAVRKERDDALAELDRLEVPPGRRVTREEITDPMAAHRRRKAAEARAREPEAPADDLEGLFPEEPAPKPAPKGMLDLGDLAGPDPESLPQKVKDAQKQTTLRMDTSPVKGPQGISDAVRRAELIVNDPKQAFLAKNKMPTQAYIDAKALLARGEKIGAGELTERLEELRGEEKRQTPKDDGTLTLFANPIPQVLQGITSHRLPSAAVLGTVGALLSDSDDPNIEKIGHFTMALAAVHAVGMKRITAGSGAVGRTMVRSMARYDAGKATLRFVNPEALLSPEIKRAIKAFELLRSKGKAIRGQWEKQLQELGPVGDRVVSDIIEMEDHGELSQLNPADMQATMDAAAGVAAEWEKIGDLKVQAEVLPQVAVDAHRGTYAGPRLYAEFEALDALGEKVAPGQPRKVRIGDQKRRVLGSDPESMVRRSELGEVREASARLRGLEKGYADVAAAKLFQSLRTIPGVVHPDFKNALDDFLAARSMWQQAKAAKDLAGQQVAEGMMQQSKADMDAITRHYSTGQGDYVSMPEGKGMGVLRGMVVTKEVANSLNGLPDLRFTGPFMRFWKLKTTVFNPGTHVGNVMSNVTMLHMAGVPAWKQPGLLRGAAKDMASYGPATQALAEAGVLDVNVVTANTEGAAGTVRATRKELLRQLKTGKKQATDVLEELGLKETSWDRLKALGDKLSGPLKRLYNNEDNIFRVAYAQHASTPVSRGGLGMTMDEAVEASRKDLIDFRSRSPAIRLLGGSIAPFILYPAKAIPTFARHVIEHPWRYLGLVAAWTALDKYSQEKVGAIDQLDLPPDQRRGWAGTALPGLTQVPFEGPSGAKGAFDIARWTPLSGLTDASPPGSATSVALDNWPRLLSPSGPVLDLGARLSNTDPYTGQKLVPRSATPGEFGEVVAEGAADLLLPPALGFHRRRLVEDLKSGDRAAVANDAAGLAGLRPRYVRPGQYQQRAQYELEQALMDAKQRLRQGLRKSQRPARDEELYTEYENRARNAQERYLDRTTQE